MLLSPLENSPKGAVAELGTARHQENQLSELYSLLYIFGEEEEKESKPTC